MFALQVGPARVIGAVLGLSAMLAMAVAALSLVGRPWAYHKSHELSGQAEVMLDVNTMGAGTFYVGQHGNRVIFFGRRDGPDAPAQDVFVRVRHGDHTEIIHANLAYVLPRASARRRNEGLLRDAHIYEMNGDQADQAVSAGGFVLDVDGRAPDPPGYSSVAASSARLAGSHATRRRRRTSVAVIDTRLDAVAWPARRAAEPRQAAPKQIYQVRCGYPGLFRLLPAVLLGAHLGPARTGAAVPGHLVGAGAAWPGSAHHHVRAEPRAQVPPWSRLTAWPAALKARRSRQACPAAMRLLDRYVGALALKLIALVAATLTIAVQPARIRRPASLRRPGPLPPDRRLRLRVLTVPSRLLQLTPVSCCWAPARAGGAGAGTRSSLAMPEPRHFRGRIVAPVVKLAVPIDGRRCSCWRSS